MAFSPQFLDELRARVGLVSVIGKRVALKRAGREHSGLCPFHNEKTPSFTVNEEKGFYHCFGCGAHGSVFDFVMETENLSFPEAVERLAAEAGMEVPQDSPEERARSERAKGLYGVLEAASLYFEKQLRMPEGKRALQYLLERGLTEETIKTYRLGFAPDGRGALKAALTKDGTPDEKLLEAGLVVQPDDEGRAPPRAPYDRFRGRVMFPILDGRGRVVAFGGRILDADPGSNAPKYLNSPETPVFQKGRLLYGLYQAREHARDYPMVIVEGYTDVLALQQAGFRTAVAPLGTALTEDQIRLVWRFSREPILCFDGDNAGERAASRAAERALPILNAGHTLRFAFLPAGEDPDSLIRTRGPDAMGDLLNGAVPLSEVIWRMERAGKPLNDPDDRAWIEKKLKDQAFKITDETVRGHYLSTFKDRLWREMRKTRPGGAAGGTKPASKSVQIDEAAGAGAKIDRISLRERILLVVLITHPEMMDDIGEQLGILDFTSPELDKLRQEVLKTLEQRSDLDFQGLHDHLCQTGFSTLLGGLLSRQVLDHATFARPDEPLDIARRGWDQVLRLYQRDRLLAEIKAVEERLGKEPNDADFRRLVELKKQQQVQESDQLDAGPAETDSGKAA